MRRSNSLSNLPVPLFKLERSKSTSRISRENRPSITDRTPIRRPMVSLASAPLSASSSVNRLSNLKRPSSILATPQSAKGKSPNKSGHTAEQFLKVRTFLQEQSVWDEKILNNLKPLTINSFVEIIKILFQELKINVELNTTNYKEILLNKLKTLNYPGTVSSSILKTVNTMHSWPHVINIFAWLIDLIVEINMGIDSLQNQHGLPEIVLENMVERFNLFNEDQYDENVGKLDEDFVNKLNKILNINGTKFNGLRSKVEQLREKKENLDQKYDESSQNLTLLQNELQQVETELDDLFNGTLQFKQMNKSDGDGIDIEAHIKNTEANIEKLKIQIDNQPYSSKTIRQMSENIDQLKHTKSLKEEKFQQWLKIRDEYDCQLVTLKKKIETKIYQLNSTLMAFKIKYPECENLMLNENSIVSKDFINQVQLCYQSQDVISTKIMEDMKNLKLILQNLKTEIDEMKCIFNQTRNELDELNEIEENLLKEIQIQENKTDVETQTFLKKREELLDLITEVSDDIAIDDLEDQLEKMQKQKLQLKVRHDEDCSNAIKCFHKNHENLVVFAGECVKIRNSIMGKLTEAVSTINNIQDDMLDELKMLETFRKAK